MSGRLNDYAKIRNIIYGNDISDETTTETSEDDISRPETPAAELDAEHEVVTDKAMHYGPSMYVKLFEEMLKTVLLGESHLFNEEERRFWTTYARLTYASRYVLVKLTLRAHKWHRMLGSARCIGNYAKDVGDGSSDAPIRGALDQLCGKRPLESYFWVVDDVSKDQWITLLASERASADAMYRKEPVKSTRKAAITPDRPRRFRKKRPSRPPPLASQIIDLTFDEEEDIKPIIQDLLPASNTFPPAHEHEPKQPIDLALPSSPSSPTPTAQKDSYNAAASAQEYGIAIETVAFVDSDPTLPELLGTLSGAELKQIAREYKLKTGGNTSELVNALLTQVGHNIPLADSPQKVQTTLSFTRGNRVTLASQADHLRKRVLQLTGICVRLSDFAVNFFRRLNDVYYRNSMYTTTLMTPAILSSAKKRTYVAYDYRRTPNIWSTREDLIAFEEAIKLEADLDALLDGNGISPARAKVDDKHSPPLKSLSPVKRSRLQTPSMTPKPEFEPHDSGENDSTVHNVIKPLTPRQLAAQAALDLVGGVLEQWRQLVKLKSEEAPRQGGLALFEAGHVLTRVICKMVIALGRLKRHTEEDDLLIELLKQTRWRRGRRGGWWERRMTLATQAQYKNPAGWQRALDIAEAALRDPDTRLALRPKLERHLTRLEKALGLAEEDRHDSDGVQLEETKTSIQGTRVRPRTASLSLDAHGRVIGDALPSTQKTLEHTLGYSLTQLAPDQDSAAHTGKSVWVGRDGEHVNVETLVLQHYEDQGYKGVHSEGSAVRVLYGILFWDIIFAPVPGAFETPFQSAPLDLAEETFIYARETFVTQRLKELEEVDGTARTLVEKVDDEHRHKNTMCVGVRWNKWAKEDLVDIVECLGGRALAAICRMQAEDFAGTGGGVPDLLCWNTTTQTAKFIEVKGPGDTLSEKQRAWIDVMARAGIDIEVCKVIDPEAAADKEKKARRRTQSRTPCKRKAKSMPAVESEDEDDQLPAATQRAMADDDDYFGAPDGSLESGIATQRPSKRKRREIAPEL